VIYQGPVEDPTANGFAAGALKVKVDGATFRYAPNLVVLDLTTPAATLRYTW
jgi:hypothetical protein